MPTDDLTDWIKRLSTDMPSRRAEAASEAVAGGALVYLPDLVELFARARGRERMPYGIALVALVQAAPAAERGALLREADAHLKLPPLLREENTAVVVSALALLEEAGDLSLMPEVLAVRSYVTSGAVARCVGVLVRAAGEAGRELARELAGSPDPFIRKIGAHLVEADAVEKAQRALAAADPARAAVVEGLLGDDRPLMRAAAAVVLQALGQPEPGPALIAAARGHGDVLVRRHALDALVTLRVPGAYACCIAALDDRDSHVVERAALGLRDGEAAAVVDAVARVLLEHGALPRLAAVVAALPSLESVDLLALVLQDARGDQDDIGGWRTPEPVLDEARARRIAQRAAAFEGPVGGAGRRALWKLLHSRWSWPVTLTDVELLVYALQDPVSPAGDAARSLLHRALARREGTLITHTMECLARLPRGSEELVAAAVKLEDDDQSREARRALARRQGLPEDGPDARLVDVAAFTADLHTGQPERRRFAARVLGRFGCRDAGPDLERALQDADGHVCAAAADALAALELEQAEAALIEALERRPLGERWEEPDAAAQRSLVAALARVGRAPALRCLLGRTASVHGDIDAAAALGRRLGPSAYDELLERLGSAQIAPRLVLVAIGATGDERAVDLLRTWLSLPGACVPAVRGLGESHQVSAIAPLLALRASAERQGHEARELHEALERALASLVAAVASRVPDAQLDALERLEDVTVTFWMGDVGAADHVSAAAVRQRAGDEQERRGRTRRHDPAPALVMRRETPIEGFAPIEDVPFLRLPDALRACPCGETPAPSERSDDGWAFAVCARGHRLRYRAAFLPLI